MNRRRSGPPIQTGVASACTPHPPVGLVTTLAGSPGTLGWADGTGVAASFNNPSGVAVGGFGTVYVADAGNSMIRKIT